MNSGVEGAGNFAIVATLESLPLAPAVITVFTMVSIIFAATTYDSASYTHKAMTPTWSAYDVSKSNSHAMHAAIIGAE